MEFPFHVKNLLPHDVTRTVGGKLLCGSNDPMRSISHDNQLAAIVDQMGVASAKAQGLRAPITTHQKLVASNHILYIMSDSEGQRGSVVGILKMGPKRLFLTDRVGVVHEVEPLCVLDFYVHESRQRTGCGKQLFEEMLKIEGLKPYEVAIDRPSPKFLGFLKKHYHLSSFVRQANNYVVFDQFFTTCKDLGRGSRRFSLPPVAKKWTLEQPDPLPSSLTQTSTKLNTSADYNWSPDKTVQTLNPSLSPHNREREFNIITGWSKSNDYLYSSSGDHDKSSTSFKMKRKANNSLCSEKDTNILSMKKVNHQTASNLVSNKAPHLQIRRGSNPRARWPISDSQLYTIPSTSHVTSELGHVRYSRYGVGTSAPQDQSNNFIKHSADPRNRVGSRKHFHT